MNLFKILNAKVQRYGYGYYIVLPTAWVNNHKITKKDTLTLCIDTQGRLVIEPTDCYEWRNKELARLKNEGYE